jgi:hypothetical protein
MFFMWNPPSNGIAVGALLPIVFGGSQYRVHRIIGRHVPKNWAILEADEIVQTQEQKNVA